MALMGKQIEACLRLLIVASETRFFFERSLWV